MLLNFGCNYYIYRKLLMMNDSLSYKKIGYVIGVMLLLNFALFSQLKIEVLKDNEGCDKEFVRKGCSSFYYSKFSKIELISINPVLYTEFNNFKKKIDTLFIPETIIIDSSKIDFSRINERSQITNSIEINNIMNLLYKNYQPEHLEYFCGYQPRNGMLFYDEQGQLVGFLEICFECNGFRNFATAPEMQNYCDEMIINLKNLFLSKGIQYGISIK